MSSKTIVTFYKLTESEINQIEQRLKAENPAELRKIIDSQAEQIKKLESQLKTIKTQQNVQKNQLLEEQKVLKNVSADYEKELKEIKSQLQSLQSTVDEHYYRINNLSYALDKKANQSSNDNMEKNLRICQPELTTCHMV